MDKSDNSGFAPIKSEFIIHNHERTLAVNCLSEEDKKRLITEVHENEDEDPSQSSKHQKLNNGFKKKLKGQNKGRPHPYKLSFETEICSSLVDITETEAERTCSYDLCKYMHNIQEYIEKRPTDIGSTCYVYSIRGRCPRGISCRFGSEHTTPSGRNIVNELVWESYQKDNQSKSLNSLVKDLQLKLRKKKYDFKRAEKIAENVRVKVENEKNSLSKETVDTDDVERKETIATKPLGCITDEDIISVRPEEKKKIDWKGKLYLSPLTTVGNLPFRRICCEMGVDITCGEMALATSLLKGFYNEWALTKRHSCEKIFGVQLCGNNPVIMARCVQLLEEQTNVDFIDLNLGCPIDTIYRQGSGSGLLNRTRVLEKVVRSMVEVTTLPITVKLRTGCFTNKNIAHTLTPKFQDWGVSLITLHGRTREQRYTRSADWSYIEQCAQLCKQTPLFGNGDVLSFEDYENVLKEHPSVSGAMIGRGALIKPWIFTEIKERRHWDISSSERLDILKKYVNYGLEHWGSDTRGVENTRRFLLEWLSFLHRYIPVGLLERLPQRINQRPPYYKGRDELETLMASSNCGDWIKISEMLLGPVPDDFNFLPKHKANSWK